MIVCVTQRRGIRYFTKFEDIGERDRLEVELRIEDQDDTTVRIDLTSALLEAYAKHPEIGKVRPVAASDVAARAHTPVSIKESKNVRPAYLSESKSKKEKDELIARVREAQLQAAEQKKQKQAEINAARAERLAAARKTKSTKEKSAPTKADRKKSTASADSRPAGALQSAVKKVSKALAEEEKHAGRTAKPAPAKAAKTGSVKKPASRQRSSARKTGGEGGSK